MDGLCWCLLFARQMVFVSVNIHSSYPFWSFKNSPAQRTHWGFGGVWETGHSLDVQLQISLQQLVHFTIIIIVIAVNTFMQNTFIYWNYEPTLRRLYDLSACVFYCVSLTVFLTHSGCNSRSPSSGRGCATRGGWSRSWIGRPGGARCPNIICWLGRSRGPPTSNPAVNATTHLLFETPSTIEL